MGTVIVVVVGVVVGVGLAAVLLAMGGAGSLLASFKRLARERGGNVHEYFGAFPVLTVPVADLDITITATMDADGPRTLASFPLVRDPGVSFHVRPRATDTNSAFTNDAAFDGVFTVHVDGGAEERARAVLTADVRNGLLMLGRSAPVSLRVQGHAGGWRCVVVLDRVVGRRDVVEALVDVAGECARLLQPPRVA